MSQILNDLFRDSPLITCHVTSGVPHICEMSHVTKVRQLWYSWKRALKCGSLTMTSDLNDTSVKSYCNGIFFLGLEQEVGTQRPRLLVVFYISPSGAPVTFPAHIASYWPPLKRGSRRGSCKEASRQEGCNRRKVEAGRQWLESWKQDVASASSNLCASTLK